jgi:hypothetical protein
MMIPTILKPDDWENLTVSPNMGKHGWKLWLSTRDVHGTITVLNASEKKIGTSPKGNPFNIRLGTSGAQPKAGTRLYYRFVREANLKSHN